MRVMRQIGYSLLDEKGNLILKPQIHVSALIEIAKKMYGKNLIHHVFSEEEVRLYDRALNDPEKKLIYTITGIPKRDGCCF